MPHYTELKLVPICTESPRKIVNLIAVDEKIWEICSKNLTYNLVMDF